MRDSPRYCCFLKAHPSGSDPGPGRRRGSQVDPHTGAESEVRWTDQVTWSLQKNSLTSLGLGFLAINGNEDRAHPVGLGGAWYVLGSGQYHINFALPPRILAPKMVVQSRKRKEFSSLDVVLPSLNCLQEHHISSSGTISRRCASSEPGPRGHAGWAWTCSER